MSMLVHAGLVHAGRILLVLLPLFFTLGAASAFAVDFNAFWQHQASGGEGRETREQFQQRYGLGAGPGLTFQPTHAISAGANLGYTRNESDAGMGTVISEEISPTANLSVSNDIFRSTLTGTITETRRSQGTDITRHTWDASLMSNWDRPYWPVFRFSYGESGESSADLEAPDAQDNKDSRYTLGADWDLVLAKLFYEYSSNQSMDLLNGSESESDSHFARLETGGTFWQKRVNLRFSQQFELSHSDFSGIALEEGLVPLPLLGGQTLARVFTADDLPWPDPADVLSLDGNVALSDGDSQSTAFSIAPDQRGHLGIRFESFSQQVGDLHVYLDPAPIARLTDGQAAQLQWHLYVRALPDETWSLVSDNVPAVYNTGESRFELTIGRQVRELMVVLTNPLPDVTLSVTELAVTLPAETSSSRQTLSITNANLRVRITDTLSASSSLILENGRSRSGESSSDSMRRSLSGSLMWTPSPYIAPSLRYSETLQEEGDAPDALSRTYSLLVATHPLPTLNVTMGATRSERFSDATKTSVSDNYSLTSTARIYPDLTATFNANYTQSSRLSSDGVFSDTDTINGRLNFNARLNPKLTADLTTNYMKAMSERSTTSSSDSVLALTYRPSDLLSMRLTGTRRWTESTTPDTLTYNLSLSLLRTHNTRVTFRYNRSQGEETRNNFGLDGSWDISRALAFQTRISYTMAETDSWNILSSLALKL